MADEKTAFEQELEALSQEQLAEAARQVNSAREARGNTPEARAAEAKRVGELSAFEFQRLKNKLFE